MGNPVLMGGIGKFRVINNIFYLLIGSATSQGLTSITFLISAHTLGPQTFGQYSSTLTLATFTSIFFNLGLNTWGLHNASRDPQNFRHILGSVVTIKLIFGLLWCSAMFILSFYVDSDTFPKNLLRLNSFVVWIDGVFAAVLLPLKVSLRNHLTSIIMILSDFLWFVVTLVLVINSIKEPEIYIEYRLFILLFSTVLTALWIVRVYQIKPKLDTIKIALGTSFPYAISEILSVSIKRIDVLIIALMLDKLAIGIYAIAVSIINALLFLLDSVSIVMIPVLSNLFVQNPNKAWKIAKRFVFFTAMSGILLMVILWMSMVIIGVFLGVGYHQSLEVLKLLSPILIIHAFVLSSASILTSTNQQSKRTMIQALGVLINVLATFFVISSFGISGVALVYLLTELFLAIVLTISVLQYYTSRNLEN